jgi:hypothetical protein
LCWKQSVFSSSRAFFKSFALYISQVLLKTFLLAGLLTASLLSGLACSVNFTWKLQFIVENWKKSRETSRSIRYKSRGPTSFRINAVGFPEFTRPMLIALQYFGRSGSLLGFTRLAFLLFSKITTSKYRRHELRDQQKIPSFEPGRRSAHWRHVAKCNKKRQQGKKLIKFF